MLDVFPKPYLPCNCLTDSVAAVIEWLTSQHLPWEDCRCRAALAHLGRGKERNSHLMRQNWEDDKWRTATTAPCAHSAQETASTVARLRRIYSRGAETPARRISWRREAARKILRGWKEADERWRRCSVFGCQGVIRSRQTDRQPALRWGHPKHRHAVEWRCAGGVRPPRQSSQGEKPPPSREARSLTGHKE